MGKYDIAHSAHCSVQKGGGRRGGGAGGGGERGRGGRKMEIQTEIGRERYTDRGERDGKERLIQ